MSRRGNSDGSKRDSADSEVDFGQLLSILWKRRRLILGITLVMFLAAVVLSLYVLPPLYESRTLILLSEHSAPAYASPATAARVLTALTFLEPLARANGISEISRKLEKLVKVEPVRDTRVILIRIRYRDPEPLRAFTQDIVSEFIRRGSERVEERRRTAQRRLETITDQLAQIGRTLQIARQTLVSLLQGGSMREADAVFARAFILNATGMSEGLYSDLLDGQRGLETELLVLEPPVLIQTPYVLPEPVFPRPLLFMTLGLGPGFVLGIIGAFFAEYFGPIGSLAKSRQAPAFARADTSGETRLEE